MPSGGLCLRNYVVPSLLAAGAVSALGVTSGSLPSVADMVLFGSGCCLIDNFQSTSRGNLPQEECLDACVGDAKCVAADVGPDGDGDTWECSLLHGTAVLETARPGEGGSCFRKEYFKAVIHYEGRHFSGSSQDFEQLSLEEGTMLGGASGLSVAFTARWDALNPGSRVIDFGNGVNEDNIVVSEKEDTTGTLLFSPSPGHSVEAPDAIVVGETHRYLCTVSGAGYMRITQDGKILAESFNGTAPEKIARNNLYVAKPNFNDAMFQGQVTDLLVWNSVVPWNDTQAKLPCADNGGCPTETGGEEASISDIARESESDGDHDDADGGKEATTSGHESQERTGEEASNLDVTANVSESQVRTVLAATDGPTNVGEASTGWHRRRRAVSAEVRDKWLEQARVAAAEHHTTPTEDGESLVFSER